MKFNFAPISALKGAVENFKQLAPQLVNQTKQSISQFARKDLNPKASGTQSVAGLFKDPLKFTPLSMRENVVPMTRNLGAGLERLTGTKQRGVDNIAYGLRGALSITPFQRPGERLQASAPQTPSQRKAQELGQAIYGTILTAPLGGKNVGLNILRRAPQGMALGLGMTAASSLLFDKKLPTGEELSEGAIRGLQNSWQLAITNPITDSVLARLAPQFTQYGLSKTFQNKQFRQGVKNLFIRALAEVPLENTLFSFVDTLSDRTKQNFFEHWINELPGNILGNLFYAGLESSARFAFDPSMRQAAVEALGKTYARYKSSPMGSEAGFIKLGVDTAPKVAELNQKIKNTQKQLVELGNKPDLSKAEANQVNTLADQLKKDLKQVQDLTQTAKATPLLESGIKTAKTPAEAKKLFKQTGQTPQLAFEQKAGKTMYAGNVTPPPEVRGGVKPPPVDFTTWKDKPVVSYSRETFDRNLRDIAPPEDYKAIKSYIIDPLRQNETQRIEWMDTLRKQTKGRMGELNIKPRSKDDALVQRFGEGRIKLEELKKATKNWQNVVLASVYFKNQYRDILKQVNDQRIKFGYDPIQPRKDYFRHFLEMDNFIKNFGNILSAEKLPTEISGMTEFFEPGKPFSTAELERKGGKFTESAIRGYDNYINSIGRQIYHIDSVQRIRGLEKYIRQAGKADAANLPNFVANVKEYGNLVAGKKSSFDRAFESMLGRQIYGFLEWARRKTGANMVAGNVSSALTNFIPFTEAASTTSKPSLLRGMLESINAPIKTDPWEIDGHKSGFLRRRFGSDMLAPSTVQKAGQAANWLFKSVDAYTARSVVAGKYYELLGRGIDAQSAMKQADEYAIGLFADRSIGELPNLMGSRTLGVFTQFQTEVNNVVSFITKDMPNMSKGNKLKLTSQLTQFVLYSYLFNNLYEKVTGRRPTIDPLHSALTIAGMDPDTEEQSFGQRLGKGVTEFAENLPFTGVFTGGRYPIGEAVPSPGEVLTDLSQGRTFKQAVSTQAKKLPFMLLPFGAAQLRKTIGAIQLAKDKFSMTKDGKIRFEAPDTEAGKIQALLFGQWSTEEAREYFQSGRSAQGYEGFVTDKFINAYMANDKEGIEKWGTQISSAGINQKSVVKELMATAIEQGNKELATKLIPVVKAYKIEPSQIQTVLRNRKYSQKDKQALRDKLVAAVIDQDKAEIIKLVEEAKKMGIKPETVMNDLEEYKARQQL